MTTGNNKTLHDFGGGDYLQHILLEKGDYTVVLQWDKNFASLGQGPNDVDLDIYLANDDGIIQYGFNSGIFGDPIEVMPFTVVSDYAYTNIIIENVTNSENVPFKYVVFRAGDNDIFTFLEHEQGISTIVVHANNQVQFFSLLKWL